MFTVKYLFQSNFSPLNVLYYLKDLKDRTRATHVAFHPYFQPEVVTYWLTAALLLREGGRGLPSDCSPPEKERQLKKSGNPPFKQPSSGISNSLFSFLSFFFFSSLKRKHEIRARPSPPPFPLPLEERGCLREKTNHWATSRANRIHTFLNAFTFYRETGFSRWKRRA